MVLPRLEAIFGGRRHHPQARRHRRSQSRLLEAQRSRQLWSGLQQPVERVAASEERWVIERMVRSPFSSMLRSLRREHSGLSISYKDFNSLKPADMKLFSVLHDCPRSPRCVRFACLSIVQSDDTTDRKHTFSIPSNLPAGNATCAFHWVPPPESSADEQVRCRVCP